MPTNSNGGGSSFAPLFRLDLKNCSKQAFEELVHKFAEERTRRKAAGTLPPNPFTADGWQTITPEMAEAALLRSGGNREINFSLVKTYATDIETSDWKPTGQTICFTAGELRDGHHRSWAGYLGLQPFESYVVTSVPEFPNAFAFYDSGKRRTNADALFIAGWNGAGKVMASAISGLALRYDHKALGVLKQPRFKAVNARQSLVYLEAHPDFQDAARFVLANYADAVGVVRSKSASVFFAWLVVRAHSEADLDEFLTPLGSGANLTEDSPILALRNKLTNAELPGQKMPGRTRLAYLCKAFLMHAAGQKMPRSRAGKIQPLSIDLDEPFHRIEVTQQPAPTP